MPVSLAVLALAAKTPYAGPRSAGLCAGAARSAGGGTTMTDLDAPTDRAPGATPVPSR